MPAILDHGHSHNLSSCPLQSTPDIHTGPCPLPNRSTEEYMVALTPRKPSWRHTTSDDVVFHPLLRTVPQTPAIETSKRPAKGKLLPASRIFLSVKRKKIKKRNKWNEYQRGMSGMHNQNHLFVIVCVVKYKRKTAHFKLFITRSWCHIKYTRRWNATMQHLKQVSLPSPEKIDRFHIFESLTFCSKHCFRYSCVGFDIKL